MDEKEIKLRSSSSKLIIKNIHINYYQRLIVVGDIHGCFDEFNILLKKIKYDELNDILISVGDFLMKGPKSLETLKFFMESKNCYSVMGNHEYTVLRWYDVINNNFENILDLKIGSEHQLFANILNNDQISYLKRLPHIIKFNGLYENLIIIHAGINPYYDLQDQKPFDIMHTRNILNKKCIEKISIGEPWVNVLSKIWKSDEIFIFGHDATRNLQRGNNFIGLDSACVYGNKLSCLIYPKKDIFSVNANKQYVLINEKSIT